MTRQRGLNKKLAVKGRDDYQFSNSDALHNYGILFYPSILKMIWPIHSFFMVLRNDSGEVCMPTVLKFVLSNQLLKQIMK